MGVKIRLKEIQLRNFKKVKSLTFEFDGNYSAISGANGSGKTTIYKAYYWCLTGKTIEPNEVIQPLDVDNNIIHKIETSVVVKLVIDDSYEVRLERKLVEDWKAVGMPDEQLKGTKQLRYFNEVPLSVAEFNAKLNAICNLDRWLMLSNINTFMGLKMEERRKLLMEAAGEINEEKLMSPYPDLYKEVTVGKKTVDELLKQTLSTKKRANTELKTIPSQIDAQDRLKVDDDFEYIGKQKDKVEGLLYDIDKQLEASGDELLSAKNIREQREVVRKMMDDRAMAVYKEKTGKLRENAEKVRKENAELSKIKAEKAKKDNEQEDRIAKIASLRSQFLAKKEEWEQLSKTTFSGSVSSVCPECGRIFSTDEIEERRQKLLGQFNKEKSERLMALQSEAEIINEQILVLTGENNEYTQIIGTQLESAIKEKESALNALQTEAEQLNLINIEHDFEYLTLKKQLDGLSADVAPNEDVERLHQEKEKLQKERDNLVRLLAYQETNKKIDKEKERLEALSDSLAQTVADCDRMLYQIREYRMSKIEAIESRVNALFKLSKWKFFEKNVSNDDYSEVCMCTHNGVDYNSTNTADRINLGCDIVYGLSKAYGISSVLFVDNKESVANIQTSPDVQLITLEHVENAPICVNNINNN